jgi:hypothetical protein
MRRCAYISITGVLLLLVASHPICAGELPYPVPFEKDCTFHVGFDDGTPYADISAGKGDGAYDPTGGGRPEFVEGIRGKAYLTGSNNPAVSYSGDPNIREEEGTLIIWAKGMPWDQGDRDSTEYLVRFGGPRGGGMLYAWIYNPVWLWVSIAPSAAATGVMQFPYLEKTNYWMMYAVTWKGQGAHEGKELARRCCLYLDGVPVGKSDNFDVSFGKDLILGMSGAGRARIALDDFTVYNRALSDAEISRYYHDVSSPANDPLVVIPPAKQPPAIDGTLSPGEWDGAAQVAGLLDDEGRPTAPRGTFQLAYDQANLYVAYQGPIPDDVKNNLQGRAMGSLLRQDVGELGGTLTDDDLVEVTIAPQYLEGQWYQLSTNNLGAYRLENAEGEVSENDALQIAGEVDADNGWVLEIALPLDALDMRGVPTPVNQPFGLNLRRAWKQLLQRTDAWAWGAYNRRENRVMPTRILGRAVFGTENDPILRVEKLGPIIDNKVPVTARVVNPGPVERKMVLSFNTNLETYQEKSLTIPAGGSQDVSINIPLESPYITGVSVQMRADEPYAKARAIDALTFWQDQRMEVLAKYYPTADVLLTNFDFSLLREIPLQKIRAEVALKSGELVCMKQEKGQFTTHEGGVRFDTNVLPAGKYSLICRLFADEKKVLEEAVPFEKRPAPEWLNNTIGISEKVPPPFTPLKMSSEAGGFSVNCWGRRYTFGASTLPEQITTQGQPILTGPMTLTLTTADGRTQELARDAGGKVTLAKDKRVEWRGEKQVAGLKATVSGWTEYDGLIWLTITLDPAAEMTVKSLNLDIPLRKEWATLINVYNYTMTGTGATPQTPTKTGSILWLGNEVGGLQQIGVNMLVTPEANRTLMTAEIISEDTTINKPTTFQLGLIATPVRPSRHCIDNLEEMCGMAPFIWGYANYSPTSEWCNPMAWPPGSYGSSPAKPAPKDKFYPQGRPSDASPYVTVDVVVAGSSDVGKEMRNLLDYYYAEWVLHANERFMPGPKSVMVTPRSKTYQDFFVWQHSKLYEQHHYTGFYYDVSTPQDADNPYAVGGGDQENGLLAYRSLVQRMYTMIRLREPEGSIRYHESGMLNGLVLPYQEMIVDGENWFGILNTNKPEYHHVMTLPMFRAQYMGTNFGPVNWWLAQPTRAFSGLTAVGRKMTDIYVDPDREARWIAGIVLLHNSGLWGAYQPGDDSPVITAMQKYALSNRRYEFIPYWNQKLVVAEPTSQNLVVSIYRGKNQGPRGPLAGGKDAENNEKIVPLPKRAVLVVFNNTDRRAGDIRLTVDWQALGFDPENIAVDAADGREAITRQGRYLIVPVTRRDVRVIGITCKQ